MAESKEQYSAWNPGLKSTIPAEYIGLSTMLRPENVFGTIRDIHEEAEFTGQDPEDVVAFRPERLIVHELLPRITRNITVEAGDSYEELGVNFRKVANTLMDRYIQPRMEEFHEHYEALRSRAETMVLQELDATLFAPEKAALPPKRRGILAGMFGSRSSEKAVPTESREQKELRAVQTLEQKRDAATDRFERAVYKNLCHVLYKVASKHGHIYGEKELLAKLATNRVCNRYGSEKLGDLVEECIDQAIEQEGYARIPDQEQPVVFSVKGPSAAGKSSLRPYLIKLSDQLDMNWDDVSVISPDIYRKFLLDYESLGEAHKYAGMLTGNELAIIDQKLDRYMSQKAELTGKLPHMVIDRFRFDSFFADSGGSRPYVLQSEDLYMFFLVTPPEETVERGWNRALEIGRYKAVDDFLAHCNEAYAGTPGLFFKYSDVERPKYNYEFLDNSVPKGERPKTIAYGTYDEMTVLDIEGITNIGRYSNVNINATRPEDVYDNNGKSKSTDSADFIKKCAEKIPRIRFADRESGIVYACLENGTLTLYEQTLFGQQTENENGKAFFNSLLSSNQFAHRAGSAVSVCEQSPVLIGEPC